ncbi:hypothetical protein B7463_g9499, partial [Scytalidium lignicola]
MTTKKDRPSRLKRPVNPSPALINVLNDAAEDRVPYKKIKLGRQSLGLVETPKWVTTSLINSLYSESVTAKLWKVASQGIGKSEPPNLYPEYTEPGRFMIAPWAKKAWDLERDPRAYSSLLVAGNSLACRFNERVGSLRSWDVCITKRYSFTDPSKDFLVIIDNMMNLDMLFWVAKETANHRLYEIAVAHAKTTQRHHIRSDNSTFHVVNYDTVTGQPKDTFTNQGYNDSSCWSRGQAWGILGFVQTFHWTGDESFLETACSLADFFITHLPDDKVPSWDFSVPVTETTPRDTSAAMIAACGMLSIHNVMRLKSSQKINLDDGSEENYYLTTSLQMVQATLTKYLNRPALRLHISESETLLPTWHDHSSVSHPEAQQPGTVTSLADIQMNGTHSEHISGDTILSGATINNYEYAPRRWADHGFTRVLRLQAIPEFQGETERYFTGIVNGIKADSGTPNITTHTFSYVSKFAQLVDVANYCARMQNQWSIIWLYAFAALWTTTPSYGLGHGSSSGNTPQMGWDTWNAYKAVYNVSIIESTVKLFEDLGLKAAGYEYIILDDGWSAMTRTADGYLQANSTTFPDGMKALVDYVHSHGLKLGLYGDSGTMTCEFRPGSWGYEQRDTLTLASWEVDYWKYDNCGGFAAMVDSPEVRFGVMNDALLLSGREIVYAVCEWGYQFPWHWGGNIGHSYRMSGDITGTFNNETGCACKTAYCLNTGYTGCSVTTIIRKMREISQYQSPGHFADMDMLEIGNTNMTLYQQQTHFAFWSALKSPLIIGADINSLSKESISILTNREIIGINQDPLGTAVNYIGSASIEDSVQVWAGRLQDGNVVLLFNEKSYAQNAALSFNNLGLGIPTPRNVRELWSGKNWSKVSKVNIVLEPYQTLVFKLQ